MLVQVQGSTDTPRLYKLTAEVETENTSPLHFWFSSIKDSPGPGSCIPSFSSLSPFLPLPSFIHFSEFSFVPVWPLRCPHPVSQMKEMISPETLLSCWISFQTDQCPDSTHWTAAWVTELVHGKVWKRTVKITYSSYGNAPFLRVGSWWNPLKIRLS